MTHTLIVLLAVAGEIITQMHHYDHYEYLTKVLKYFSFFLSMCGITISVCDLFVMTSRHNYFILTFYPLLYNPPEKDAIKAARLYTLAATQGYVLAYVIVRRMLSQWREVGEIQ